MVLRGGARTTEYHERGSLAGDERHPGEFIRGERRARRGRTHAVMSCTAYTMRWKEHGRVWGGGTKTGVSMEMAGGIVIIKTKSVREACSGELGVRARLGESYGASTPQNDMCGDEYCGD